MSCDPALVSWYDECIREEDEEAVLSLVALSQTSVERKDECECECECEFIQTTSPTYCVGLSRARGAPVAEHAFFLYPRGKKLSNRKRDTHDCKAMCSNHAISPYQTSTVGIIRYVCLGHPSAVERKDELGVPRPDSISPRVLSVSLGDVSRTISNRPEGSKLHNLVIINYSDGTTERNGT